MVWWNEIALLKRQLKEVQNELEKEQGKATRLSGFMARLQTFGVSPTGQAPRQPFAEALMDTVHTLLKVEQAALFETDTETFDLAPMAAIGFSPEVLSTMRVHPGEGALGRAAQDAKIFTGTSDAGFLTAPYMITPLLSQGQCAGLLLVSKPQNGSFSPEDRGILSLLAAQAALVLEDHTLYEDLGRARAQAVAGLARALDAKDPLTHRHSDRTRALVRAFAQEVSLPEMLIQEIEVGAFLHDVGKIGIEDSILKDKPFFPDLLSYIQGKIYGEEYQRVLAMVYRGDNAIQKVRDIAGSTNPEEADSTSIRGAYGRITTKGVFENVIHASSSPTDAEREIKLWFKPLEIVGNIYPTQKGVIERHEETVWT